MTAPFPSRPACPPGAVGAHDRRRSRALALFVTVQALAAVFFLGDVLFDLIEEGPGAHLAVEAVVAAALVAGLGFGLAEMRRTLDRLRVQEDALRIARGELADVVARQFAGWALTPAEEDVAWLALKGLDTADIAAARGAAQGTVRAQLTRIYAKAGVSGRAQLAAWFVEDLLSDGTARGAVPVAPGGTAV